MENNYIEVCDFESLEEAVDEKKEVIYVSGTPAKVLSFFAKISPSQRDDIFVAATSKGVSKTVFDNTYGLVAASASVSAGVAITWELVVLVATILAFVIVLIAIFKDYDVELVPEVETTTTVGDKPKNTSKFRVRLVLKTPEKV